MGILSQISKLQAENERLKAENQRLIKIIGDISPIPALCGYCERLPERDCENGWGCEGFMLKEQEAQNDQSKRV